MVTKDKAIGRRLGKDEISAALRSSKIIASTQEVLRGAPIVIYGAVRSSTDGDNPVLMANMKTIFNEHLKFEFQDGDFAKIAPVFLLQLIMWSPERISRLRKHHAKMDMGDDFEGWVVKNVHPTILKLSMTSRDSLEDDIHEISASLKAQDLILKGLGYAKGERNSMMLECIESMFRTSVHKEQSSDAVISTFRATEEEYLVH